MVDYSSFFILYEYIKRLFSQQWARSLFGYSHVHAICLTSILAVCLLFAIFVKKTESSTQFGLKVWLQSICKIGFPFLAIYLFWGNSDLLFAWVAKYLSLSALDFTTAAILTISGVTGITCFIIARVADKTPNNNSTLNFRQKNSAVSVICLSFFVGCLSWRYINGLFNIAISTILIAAELISIVFWFYDPLIYIFARLLPKWLTAKKPARTPTPGKINRFAVIGCAHNEETVIGQLIESLLGTSYPKNKFDIFVICDNCTDGTADIVRSKGAIAMERHDTQRKGKGFGLEWMFAHLTKWREEGDAYDAYIVLDADNLVNERFFDEINDKLNQGYEILQAYLGCKNPGDTWISKCYTMAYWLSNSNYQDAHARIGLSAQMGGTGMVFRPCVLEEVGWRTDSLTEDLVLTANYTLKKDQPCMWVHSAKLYDEKPLDMKPSIKQRTRWMQGHNKAMREYAPQLFLAAIQNRSLLQLDMAFYLMRPFLNFCLFVTYIIRIFGSLFMPGSVFATGFVMNFQSALILMLAYTLIQLYVLSEENYLRYFIWIPLQWVFTYSWYPAFFRGIVKCKELFWVSTVHHRSISIEDVREDVQLVDARKRLEGLDNLHRLPLGQILLKAAVITKNQLDQALDIQKEKGGYLGDIVLQMHALTPDVLESYIQIQSKMREESSNTDDSTLKLGNLLVAAEIITPDQLEKALAYQVANGGRVGEALVKTKCLTDDMLGFFLSVQKVLDENYLSNDKSQVLIHGLVDNGGMSFGLVLYSGGLISKQQLKLALELKEKEGCMTGEALMRLGFINQTTLNAILKIQEISREHGVTQNANESQLEVS